MMNRRLCVRISAALFAAAITLAGPISTARALSGELKQLYQQVVASYKAKDYAAMLKAASGMLALDPRNPKYVFNVASAEALSGDNASASKHLLALVERGVDFGIDDEDDFAALRASKEFEPVRRALDKLGTPLGKADAAFSLTEKD